jgi:hypothetical protein
LQEEYKGLIRENDIDQDLSWNEIRKKADQELLELFKNRKPDDDISIFLGPLREDSQRDMNTGEFIPIKRHWTSKEELNPSSWFLSKKRVVFAVSKNVYLNILAC